jgi:DNA-directed RNA polymerase specialized sigma24 family protein
VVAKSSNFESAGYDPRRGGSLGAPDEVEASKEAGTSRPRLETRETTTVDLERALLAIDVFPRAALLLSIFEGVPVADAAILLDAEPQLVRKAQAIGLMELTSRLARMQGWTSAARNPLVVPGETQYA